jgi:hypothetical protein
MVRPARFERATHRFVGGQVANHFGVEETTVQGWESGETKKIRRFNFERLGEIKGAK